MKKDIKERIEKIKNGEVPEGYKKTKLGIIPKTWEISKGFIKIVSGFGFKLSDYSKSGIPLIRINNVKWGKMDYSDVEFLPKSYKKQYDNFILKRGDILLALNRPITQKRLKLSKLDSNEAILYQRVGKLIFNDGYLPDFYYQYLHSDIFIYRLENLLVGSDQPYIKNSEFNKIKFVKPTIEEQQKIAQTLSTWDKAIELKEQLIKQKKEQKRGLMQKLLTGELRLSGFEGKWKEYKAGKIFLNISNKKHNGLGEVLSVTQENGVIPRSQLNIDIKYDKNSLTNYKKVEKGNFVISLRSFQGGIEYSNYEGLVSPAYTVLNNDLTIYAGFYKALFKTTDFITYLNSVIYGIRDGKQISYKDFSILKLPYPPVEEQKAIGKILSAEDKEIDLLKQELEALKIQKKGLMQLLLTGIIRVNN